MPAPISSNPRNKKNDGIRIDSPAVAWALEKFQFDLSLQREHQFGVKQLQQWLVEEGAKLDVDGYLGPITFAALEQSFAKNNSTNLERSQSRRGKTGVRKKRESSGKNDENGSSNEKTKNKNIEKRVIKLSNSNKKAIAWAEDRFQFDSNELDHRQPGLEELQKWLFDLGYRLTITGRLDSETLKALQDRYETTEGRSRRRRSRQTSQDVAVRPIALSDSAIEDADQDRLGFGPYVEAVAEFILARQTKPPLTIAINAPWGHGKTSFMNMLENQLKLTDARVATTWFNPWKYNEPEQVWASFVANITDCLRHHLTTLQTIKFLSRRLGTKLYRLRWDISLWLRAMVAALFLSLIACLAFLNLEKLGNAILEKHGLLEAFKEMPGDGIASYFWSTATYLGLALAILLAYIGVANRLGLNLLQYIEQTDFKDKIGTVSQFGHEMKKLRETVPHDLKVVVFVDDLDRCNGKILGELIEALQLAEISRTCIFVMGMDMHIVARALEAKRPELADSAGNTARMEHGRGYRFLEKIIQARLTLPTHKAEDLEDLIDATMLPKTGNRDRAPQQSSTKEKPQTSNTLDWEKASASELLLRLRQGIGLPIKTTRVAFRDSDVVIKTARHYGSQYFRNPRRLKRFINGFRLQTYISAAVQKDPIPVDRLARFLVLAERWPAVIAFILEHELGSLDLMKDGAINSTNSIFDVIDALQKSDREQLHELLDGPGRRDPLSAGEWRELSDFCGFGYYEELSSG